MQGIWVVYETTLSILHVSLVPRLMCTCPERRQEHVSYIGLGTRIYHSVMYLVYMCILYTLQLTSVKELSTASITMSIGVV